MIRRAKYRRASNVRQALAIAYVLLVVLSFLAHGSYQVFTEHPGGVLESKQEAITERLDVESASPAYHVDGGKPELQLAAVVAPISQDLFPIYLLNQRYAQQLKSAQLAFLSIKPILIQVQKEKLLPFRKSWTPAVFI